MTVVLLHGVPETAVIWNGVRDRLEADGMTTVALDLPGFGAPSPTGFGATKDEYAAWLTDALSGVEGPVDIVGHDWGAGIALRAVTALDVPVRSWAIDGGSGCHPDFVWHDMAQVWQAPDRGEEWMAAFVAAAAEAGGQPGEPGWLKNALLASCPDAVDAARLHASIDDTMGECILALYRSAVPNLFADWGTELSSPPSAPGLILRATEDDFDDPVRSAEMAAMLGASTADLVGRNHWWMLEDPASAATTLRSFWSSLPQG